MIPHYPAGILASKNVVVRQRIISQIYADSNELSGKIGPLGIYRYPSNSAQVANLYYRLVSGSGNELVSMELSTTQVEVFNALPLRTPSLTI